MTSSRPILPTDAGRPSTVTDETVSPERSRLKLRRSISAVRVMVAVPSSLPSGRQARSRS